ncbi:MULTISPECIES: DUF2142 domain-containing protein [Streptacidiphilus]|uniref:DUF2142 domain-containing protein n=1 Tax=Streptacidiphilus cavernicola TaxID=3342716 RepID=A0ABV6UGE6_9ACTN|nr:DUF2142 domain-containing protein [Streptacidiphilus jeojiense]
MRSPFPAASTWLFASRLRLGVASFAVFFMLMSAWSFATPLTAAPDEPDHITRAASVVRGQINGPDVSGVVKIENIPRQLVFTGIKLPSGYDALPALTLCYRHDPTKPASCAAPFKTGSTTVSMTTGAGRYNPAYYLMIGWPSLFLKGPSVIYAMRLLSAVLCALLMALAVVTASTWRKSTVLVGVYAAATPMTLFLGGVVNPNAVEAAAGILAWTALLPVFLRPDPELLRSRMAYGGIAAVSLFCIRPLGLLWVAAVLLIGLLVAQRGVLRSILRRRVTWVWTAVSGVAFLLGEAWNLTHPDHSNLGSLKLSTVSVAKSTFLYSRNYITNMIGDFGWLETTSPYATYVIWTAVVIGLVLLGWSCARRREVLALVALILGIVFIPVIGNAYATGSTGPIWQGRYLLAFAAGLPILASMLIAKYNPLSKAPAVRLNRLIGAALTAASFMAFWGALHRYMVGVNGRLIPLHADWTPPAGALVWVLLILVGLVAQWCLLRAFDPAAQSAAPAAEEPAAALPLTTDGAEAGAKADGDEHLAGPGPVSAW